MALAILLCLILFFLAVISTIVLGLVLVFVARTSANLRSSGFRGSRGEMVVRMACRSLDKRNYVTIHNVTIPTRGDDPPVVAMPPQARTRFSFPPRVVSEPPVPSIEAAVNHSAMLYDRSPFPPL